MRRERSKDRRHHDEATRRVDRVTIDPLASIQFAPQQKQRRADVAAPTSSADVITAASAADVTQLQLAVMSVPVTSRAASDACTAAERSKRGDDDGCT